MRWQTYGPVRGEIHLLLRDKNGRSFVPCSPAELPRGHHADADTRITCAECLTVRTERVRLVVNR